MKHYTPLILLILFANLFSLPSMASNYASSKQLQTFFTSPGIRFQLNQQRNSGKYDLKSDKQSVSFSLKPLQIKMQGIVLRDKHKPVIFVNDSNTLKSQTVDEQITIKTNRMKVDSVIVPVKVNSESIKLKPGQQWNESDRKTRDNYQIKPAKAKPDGIATEIISKIID